MSFLQKFNLLIHQIVYWLYNDADKAFFTGGFIGAGFTSTLIHINYWYWAKVVVSAIIGGVVNIAIKRLVDFFHKRKGNNHE